MITWFQAGLVWAAIDRQRGELVRSYVDLEQFMDYTGAKTEQDWIDFQSGIQAGRGQ